jgi:hypothetical protein
MDNATRPRSLQPELLRELVDRVAGGPALQKSNRLRELLLFLCERALSDPGQAVREQEIGVAVFNRPPGYDTGQDTLVRVQVSQLRKKLQQHFAAEGREESVEIEIPRGSYTPLFRDRALVLPPPGSSWSRRLRGISPWTLVFAILAAVASGLSVWMAIRLGSHGAPQQAGFEPRPAVDRLWRQVFGNGRPACLVPSDANLVVFQDLIGRQLTINEYRRSHFGLIADERIQDPERRAVAKLLVSKSCTPVADAQLAGELEVLNAFHRIHTDVVFARDFGPAYLESHNVILLGTRRANPWMELFESQLNFRTKFQESPQVASFENRAPLSGEEAAYPGTWGKLGYCRLAFLPNQARNGHVLLISGTDMASTQAGGQFIGSQRWVDLLRSRLGLSPQAPFPYFEVLLRVEFPATRAPRFDLIAHRIP